MKGNFVVHGTRCFYRWPEGLAMVWTKLNDGYPEDCAGANLSDAAFRTHTEGLCWTMRRLSEGHITKRDLARFAETGDPDAAVDELVMAGWWVLHPDGDGWMIIHDMAVQRSKAQVLQDQAANAERQRRYRDKSNAVTYGVSNGERNASRNAPQTRPDQKDLKSSPGQNAVVNAVSNAVTVEASQLLDQHLAAYKIKPPRDVIQRTGEKIDSLIAEGYATDVIREALVKLRAKPNLGPGVLPAFINEISQKRGQFSLGGYSRSGWWNN
jgi:hypothetical protein